MPSAGQAGYAQSMTLLQFRNEDARIVYLATIYHLGRPGAEVRAVASDAGGQGLQAIYDEILPRLNQAVVEVEASAQQILRLNDALLGVANELKQFGIANGRTMVPRFAETLRELFPETAEEPGVALDLVQHPVMLRNRLAYAIEQARAEVEAAEQAAEEERKAKKKWWQVWRSE